MRTDAPEETIARIDLECFFHYRRVGGTEGGLTIARREEDAAVQRLQAPAVFDELDGEPVEQLRMRGRCGAGPEVARGVDESGPEMVRPDPVDDDAGGEGIFRIDDGPGELEPTAPDGKRRAFFSGEDREELPRHGFALRERIPAQEDTRGHGESAIRERERGGNGFGRIEKALDDGILELPEGIEGFAFKVGLHIHDGSFGDLAGRTGTVRDRAQSGIVVAGFQDGGVAGDDLVEVMRGRGKGGSEARVGSGDGERRILIGARLAIGVPVAEDGVLPLASGAQVVAPGMDEGGEEIGLLKNLVKAVGGILVELGLRGEIVREALPHPVGRLKTELCHGLVERFDPILLGFGKFVIAPGERDELFDAAVEDAVEGVVVGGGDGIVLVIVTAGARDGQPEHAPGHDVDAVIDNVVFHPEETAAEGEESHRREIARIFVRDLIGGELEQEKAVIGHIPVQRRHDPVPIGPGVGPVFLLAGVDIAFRVGVAGHVEPVPRPVLAVVGRVEETVDEPGVGLRVGVVHESGDLLVRGRQAREGVGKAADESAAIGPGRGLESGPLQPGADEKIDRITCLVGQDGRADGLEGPVAPRESLPVPGRAHRCARRPGQSQGDPLLEVRAQARLEDAGGGGGRLPRDDF